MANRAAKIAGETGLADLRLDITLQHKLQVVPLLVPVYAGKSGGKEREGQPQYHDPACNAFLHPDLNSPECPEYAVRSMGIIS